MVVCYHSMSLPIFSNIQEGTLPKTEFIYKKLCIYCHTFEVLSPSKCSPFDAVHLLGHFFHCSKQFLYSWILAFFSAPAISSPLSFHIGKSLPFEDFFSSGETKESHLGWDRVNREGGAWGSCFFYSKTAEPSAWRGQVHYHEMGKCVERVFKKMNWSRNQPLTTTPAGTLIQMGS